jgi:hypothetical protein
MLAKGGIHGRLKLRRRPITVHDARPANWPVRTPLRYLFQGQIATDDATPIT